MPLRRPQAELVAAVSTNSPYFWGSLTLNGDNRGSAAIASNRRSRPMRIGSVERLGTNSPGEGNRGFGPGPPIVVGNKIAFRGTKRVLTRSSRLSYDAQRQWMSRLRAPVVVNPARIELARPIDGALAPLSTWRRVYVRSELRPPQVVTPAAPAAVYSGPAVRRAGQSRLYRLPTFSRLPPVIVGATSGPPIRGYLTPPLDRVPISNSFLRPPAVLRQPESFYGPNVTLAPSSRGVPKSHLEPPAVVAPVLARPIDITLAPQRRGTPKSRLQPPAVVAPVLARPILVHLAPSSRGKAKPFLRGPVVQTALAVPSTVTLFPLLGRVPAVHSHLRPPETPTQPLNPPVAVTLAYSLRGKAKSRLSAPVDTRIASIGTLATTLAYQSRGKAKSILRGPVRPTDLAAPSTVTLFPITNRIPAANSRLSPPAVVAPVLARAILVHLAPSSRGVAKSKLLPPEVVASQDNSLPRPHEGYLAPLRDWRRVYTRSFLRPPTTTTATVVYPPIKVTLVRIRPVRTQARLLPVPSAFQPVGTLRVHLAYSLRGTPRSRLRPPVVVAPVLARPIDVTLAPQRRGVAKSRLLPVPAAFRPVGELRVTLAYSLRGTPKSKLRPPVVVAAFQARPIDITLVRIRPPRTIAILRRPIDLVDRDDLGTTRIHLAYSLRGKAKSRLSPPAVVAPVLARKIDVTLAPQRRGVPKSRLYPPTDLVDQQDVGQLRVHLTYSLRGRPKSILRPPVPPETFRGLAVHLAPSSRGKTRSFFIPTPIAFQAVELSGPEVTLVRIRPPQTRWSLPQASLFTPQPKAEYDLRVTLAYSLRGKPKSKLRPPTVVTPATPYFRRLPVTLAPQRRGTAKSFLRPPVVVRRFVAAPISITLAPQPKPRTISRLRNYIVPPPFVARPALVWLAPSTRGRPKSILRPPAVVARLEAGTLQVTLARITPPPVHSRLRPPAVVGAGVYFRGIQVHLAYSVRGKTMSRLSFTELAIVECYGDAMCGFDFAADVCGSDEAPTVLGTTAAGSNVRGTDVAPTVEGASAASGSVSGDDARREGC